MNRERDSAATSCHGAEPAGSESQEHDASCHGDGTRTDWLLIGASAVVIAALAWDRAPTPAVAYLGEFSGHVTEVLGRMWWGMAASFVVVCVLSRVPREFVTATLGPPGAGGILRAVVAGVLLDLCSHGILLVASRLYERGASSGQVTAFLIASPWNSLALTLILVSLIGLPLTLTFIGLSMLIALATGLAFQRLVAEGHLPGNPNTVELPADFAFFAEAKRRLRRSRWGPGEWRTMLSDGLSGSRMVFRWILAGVVLAAAIRTALEPEAFRAVFGPSLAGLAATLVGATILEVCSEGSAPIAGDLARRAGAPGNAFAFLMAGVATDVTEIIILKNMARSWKFALALPALALPQIVLLGWILNAALT